MGTHAIGVGPRRCPFEVVIEGHVGLLLRRHEQAGGLGDHQRPLPGRGSPRTSMSGSGASLRQRLADRPAASGHGGLLVVDGDTSFPLRHLDEGHRHRRPGLGRPHERLHGAEGATWWCAADAGANLGDSIFEAVLFVRGAIAQPRRRLHREGQDPARAHRDASAGCWREVRRRGRSRRTFRRYGSARTLYQLRFGSRRLPIDR